MGDFRLWSSSIVAILAIVGMHVFQKRLKGVQWKTSTLTWEFAAVLIPTFVLLPIIAIHGESMAARDTEWWGSYVTRATYYEDWDEYIYQICTRTVSCGKDCTTIETYDCSYVDYHPEYWEIEDNIGQVLRISRERWLELKQEFGGATFVDMHRSYHSNDGDSYVSIPKKNQLRPVTTTHSYENRVGVAHSVFSYEPVSKEEQKFLFGYPKLTDCLDRQCVLSNNTRRQSEIWQLNRNTSTWNALLGSEKQCRIWFLVFSGGTRKLGMDQERLWKGGNKNELVVCFGIDESTGKASWCHPFSWSEKDDLKIDIRTFIESSKWNELWELADYVGENAMKRFERKHFHEFDYLSVPMPTGTVVAGWLVNIVATAVACYISMTKEGFR